MYIVLILLLVSTVVVGSIVSLVLPRKPLALDPRIVLLRQYEVGLMAHIRDRYSCTDDEAREVRRKFLEWEMDAAGSGVGIGEDGKLSLSDDAVDTIDRYASKVGLHPAPIGEESV
jgi:hypothetical protein